MGEISSQNLVHRLLLVVPVFGEPEIMVCWVNKYNAEPCMGYAIATQTSDLNHCEVQMFARNNEFRSENGGPGCKVFSER